MNKKKILILSLSAILFLAVSFIVYSWTEPTTMPSSYNSPINTSSTAQTKTGEIGASMFRDADNSNYYINPSGNSVVSGNITAADPLENNHVSTKGYVDSLLGNIEQNVSLSNLIYAVGSDCPDGSFPIMKHWLSQSCSGPYYCSWPPSCSTPAGWSESAPTCEYCLYNGSYSQCTSNSWDSLICVKLGDPLYNNLHSTTQCEYWDGEILSDGADTFCKINASTCPYGWIQYKNWSTTIPATSSYPSYEYGVWDGTVYTGSHNWSNTPRESYYCHYTCQSCWDRECIVGYNYGDGGENVYATITQIGCY